MCGSGVLPPTRGAPPIHGERPRAPCTAGSHHSDTAITALTFSNTPTSTEWQNISGLLHMLTVNFADFIDGYLKRKGEAILKYFK